MDPQQVILRPVVTEKSYRMKGQAGSRRRDNVNAIVFEVHPKASKPVIKKAVEEIYDVKVDKVNTLSVSGKWRRRGKTYGRTKNWKKAVVFLSEGHSLTIY